MHLVVLRELEDERGFATVHFRLETALVESFSDAAHTTSMAAESNETSTTLYTRMHHVSTDSFAEGLFRRADGILTRKAAVATPTPTASTDVILRVVNRAGLERVF